MSIMETKFIDYMNSLLFETTSNLIFTFIYVYLFVQFTFKTDLVNFHLSSYLEFLSRGSFKYRNTWSIFYLSLLCVECVCVCV